MIFGLIVNFTNAHIFGLLTRVDVTFLHWLVLVLKLPGENSRPPSYSYTPKALCLTFSPVWIDNCEHHTFAITN